MKLITSAALLSMAMMAAPTAHACSCPSPGLPAVEAGGSDAVFVGTVVAVKDSQPADTWWNRLLFRMGYGTNPAEMSSMREIRYTFDVGESFKGAVPQKVTVVSAASGASCGYTFLVRARYVVYAHSMGDGRLKTGHCSLTGPAAVARHGLGWLQANRGRLSAPVTL